MEFFKSLTISIIGGIIAGIIVGIFLYNLYDINPKLYAACSYSYNPNSLTDVEPFSLNLEIENTGEPAMNFNICLIPISYEGGNPICNYPQHLDKLGKGLTKLEINVKQYRDNIPTFRNETLKVNIWCSNCKNELIEYSTNCLYIK
ncbi:MAG: hypothetical protein AABW67_06285 [Nanoarchaeota archaeon]